MKIYLDVLFVTNAIITLMYICSLAKITHSRIRRSRAAVSSLIGGISAILLVIQCSTFFQAMLITLAKLGTITSVILSAFGRTEIKRFIRLGSLYIILNLIFGGCCLIIWQLTGGRIIYIRNYTVYFDISLMSMIFCSLLAYGVITVYDLITSRAFRRSKRYRARYIIGDYEITIPAVADSGNALCDVFTGIPVVIFCCSELFEHFDLDYEDRFNLNGFRLIPCRTVNGEGLISVTTRGRVEVIDEMNISKEVRCCVGIVRSDNCSARAIFNPQLLM